MRLECKLHVIPFICCVPTKLYTVLHTYVKRMHECVFLLLCSKSNYRQEYKIFCAPHSCTLYMHTIANTVPLQDDRFFIILDNRGSITIIMSDVIHFRTFCNLTKRDTDEVLITLCVGINTKKLLVLQQDIH